MPAFRPVDVLNDFPRERKSVPPLSSGGHQTSYDTHLISVAFKDGLRTGILVPLFLTVAFDVLRHADKSCKYR